MLKRAQELDPLSPLYPAEAAWSAYISGDFEYPIIEEAKNALDLSPEFPFALFALGTGYSAKKMYKEAIEVQQRSAELSPDWKWGLAHTYAKAGMTEEAYKIIIELESEPSIWDTWCLATVYAALQDADKTFYWLEEAFNKRHPYIQWLVGQEAYFGHYKNEPRYKDLLKRLNFQE